MRKILLSLAAASLAAVSFNAVAQTTPVDPQDPAHQTFFTTVTGYFTGFNTNLEGVLPTHKGTLSLSQDFQGGAHAATSLGLGYLVYKQFSLESETRFEDVSGNVRQQLLGVGYNIDVHDVRVTGSVSGIADVQESKYGAAVSLSATKLLTEHTFITTAITVPFTKGSTRPMLKLGTGFVF